MYTRESVTCKLWTECSYEFPICLLLYSLSINTLLQYRHPICVSESYFHISAIFLCRVIKKSLWTIIDYIRNMDRAILNTVFENTVRRVYKCLLTGGETLSITCNFLYRNHQVHRDFLITLYLMEHERSLPFLEGPITFPHLAPHQHNARPHIIS